ncbi:MAG: NUDIX hydrolase [Anaeromicrobium sp.]|uniref:NUDIX domain-containing protein n=1 Tax=Anaeromicrobium sp. TaxID=1929132 RepID=UPI0025E286E6|nr:NUDIX hydrolase [Anaeromicrobium sp.]MCT4593720.1 NUDIX hydrolase [Anaeromicrobium sp.]
MREEVSSGGVVLFGNAILLLKKYNGDWVLPKGKIKKDENKWQAALREVYEEGRVKGEIIDYIDNIKYSFKNCWNNHEVVEKTVHWYLMKTKSMNCAPLKEEGFIEARFVHMNRALSMIKYDDERLIVKKVLDILESRGKL